MITTRDTRTNQKRDKRAIELIISYCYDRKHLILDFMNFSRKQHRTVEWTQVLSFRDWSFLQELNIDDGLIRGDQIRLLGQLDWPKLYRLTLQKNTITAQHVCLILKKVLPMLQILNLGYNNIGDEGMKTLFTTNSLPKLKRLYLDKNGISSLSFTSFIPKMPAQHSLSGLQFLSLNDNRIGLKGIQLLVKAELNGLRALAIRDTKVGIEGMKTLSKSNWPQMLEMTIYWNDIAWDDDSQFMKGNWKNLTSLKMHLSENSKSAIAHMSLVSATWAKTASVLYRIENNEIRHTVQNAVGRSSLKWK